MATTTINGLPVYKATLLNDKCGMKKISLVDYPAVETDFVAFAEQEQPQRFAVQDEDKHLLAGVIMRANYPIYRRSKQAGEYYILYTADTIREMAERYLAEGRANNVNLQHEDGSDVDGVQLVQFYIKDTAKGIAPAGFDDIEDGSLFGEFHCTNEDVWQSVKAGTYKGFSLEGIFGTEAVDAVVSTEKMENTNKGVMRTIMERVKAGIAARLAEIENEMNEAEQEQTFGSVTTDKGVMRWEGDAALEIGNAVLLVAQDGTDSKPEDGVYTTESHTIVVEGGRVKEIQDAQSEQQNAAEQEEAAPEAESAEQQQEEEAVAAEQAEDAADVVEEAQGEVSEQTEVEAAAEIEVAASASYFAKWDAICRAFEETGLDCWLVDAGDTFAIVDIWEGEERHTYRYAISFREDGSVEIGERVEVFLTYATAEEKAEIEDRYAALEAERDTLAARVQELSAEPSAEPAHAAFAGMPILQESASADNKIKTLESLLG